MVAQDVAVNNMKLLSLYRGRQVIPGGKPSIAAHAYWSTSPVKRKLNRTVKHRGLGLFWPIFKRILKLLSKSLGAICHEQARYFYFVPLSITGPRTDPVHIEAC